MDTFDSDSRRGRPGTLLSGIMHARGSLVPGKMVLSGFAIAIVLCIAIIIVRLAAGYHSGDPPMLVLYIIPVIIASYVGGLGPGLFCTFLAGGLAAYFLLPPFDSLRIESLNNQLNLAMMILTGLVVTFVVNSLHSQRVNVEKSNERYRIVAENTYSWEFWLDSKGNSLYQSPSCARITGYDVSEYMSNPDHLIKIVHPGDLELFRAHRHTVTSEKGPGNLQFRIIRPDSEVRWIEHFCLPVFGEDGTYLGTRGSNNDITDRKLMEETMIRTEKMVTVGGLAAGMAHELNNPLGGILQSLQNIRRRVSPELPANIKDAQANGCTLEALRGYLESRHIFKFLDSIEECGQRAARIVGTMLEFSRKVESRTLPVPINELVEKAITLCRAYFVIRDRRNFTDIVVEKQLDPTSPTIRCEPSQIEQVLVHLLRNAAQAHERNEPSCQPRIIVRTRSMNDFVFIEVEDNGPGMEEDELKHAFDPFFTTKDPGKGTGLGLSVAFYIISNHKGTLTAQSRPGEGAKLVISLPV